MPVHSLEDDLPEIVPVPEGPWQDRVRYHEGGRQRFAYRPGRILVYEDEAWAQALELLGRPADPPDPVSWLGFRLLEGVPEDQESWLVDELRQQGHRAEHDYVLFADGVEANPAWANPAWANPAWANPAWANPAWANPAWANPAWANPAWANPVPLSATYPSPLFTDDAFGYLYRSTGARRSTARPARAAELGEAAVVPHEGAPWFPQVLVADTGLAWRARIGSRTVAELPPLLARLGRPDGSDVDLPDRDGNGHLDPVAGHGTFIAGIVERMAPGCSLGVVKVLSGYGDGSVSEITSRLLAIAAAGLWVDGAAGIGYWVEIDENAVVNLSFSGYAPREMETLSTAIRQIRHERRGPNGPPVFVASAGNDATTAPAYPACLDDVVAVGALGPYGPAAFTNAGPWVQACAPGVDVVSAMFADFDGPIPEQLLWPDPDRFQGWARWSGTSFAAPVVVAAICREMLRSGSTAEQAKQAVIDSPWAFRIPGLGTVVNEG